MEWSAECDTLLLQEIIVAEPFTFKPSTRERGKSWDDITARLNANPAFQNKLKQKRAVRDRYTLLAKKYRKKMAEEEAASGISPDHTEQENLLEQIIEQFEEAERDNNEKGEAQKVKMASDRAKAEEMRRKSMEKLSETTKRKADEGQGEVQSTPTKRRASGSETIVYLREKAEKEYGLRKEEVELKKEESAQQVQMFQLMQQQLQQQQQQQQQQLQLQHQHQQLQTQLLMALIEKINK